jgi:polyisoprenyl-phosphate glycosyltransferase
MLTVIVPVHNEEANIDMFYDRILPVLSSMEIDWEIVFTNNASTDGTVDRIRALNEKDSRVKLITLSRNFGYQVSLVAGLTSRQSDLYAIVDVDCEDPPELLPKFYEEIQKGAQTAYGIRSRREEAFWIMGFRWLFYWINRQIADAPIRLWMAEFMMITRTVRDAILANRSTFPFLRAEIGYVGMKTVGVPYLRASRKHGVTHYNFFRMTQFAVGGFLASSTFPLRATLYLSAALAAAYLGLVFGWRLDLARASQWAVVFGFAYLLFSVPMLSLYMARAYKNTLVRPLYFIDPQNTFLE